MLGGTCTACRPATPSPEVPMPRRGTSTRLRQQPPAQRPRQTTRIRKRHALPLLIGAGAVLALAIGIAIAAGGPSPAPPSSSSVVVMVPPPPEASPAAVPQNRPSLDEILAQVREKRGDDLLFERREEILRLLKDAAARAGIRLEEVDQIAADYDRKFEDAAARLADFTRSEALRMASKGKIPEAIERVDGYPAPFRASKSAEKLRLLRRDLEARIESPSATPPKRVL
jgi:hypothetical protein